MAREPWAGSPHVLESQQFSKDSLKEIFALADKMRYLVTSGNRNILPRKERKKLKHKKMVALFYEASTRTRVSCELAMHYLGGKVVSTENAREFSSAVKGETLEDTIRVLCGYRPDVIVLRYDQEGGAARAAKVSSVPIINAGDGAGQHPTQALLDLYTIKQRFGRIKGLVIAMVGDLANGRTVRSLCYLLGKFEIEKLYFVSPPWARMKDDIKDYLKKRDTPFYEVDDIRQVAYEVDVIYQTRTQKERGSTEIDPSDPLLACYAIDQGVLNRMSPHAAILHPLPRCSEMDKRVDGDPRVNCFQQAENGLYVRMALLHTMFLGA